MKTTLDLNDRLLRRAHVSRRAFDISDAETLNDVIDHA